MVNVSRTFLPHDTFENNQKEEKQRTISKGNDAANAISSIYFPNTNAMETVSFAK